MSNRVISLVLTKVVGSATRKGILMYFADKASDDGRGIWTSKSTIAGELELARSTVIKVVNELVADGLIAAVGRRPHQNGSTVEYDINLTAVRALPNVKLPKADPSDSRTSPPDDPSDRRTPPVRQSDGMMSDSRTQTILKPSMNQTRAGGGADARDESFQGFWEAHPKPRNPQLTRQMLITAQRRGAKPEHLITAAERYREQTRNTPEEYVSGSDSWLKKERWKDFPDIDAQTEGPSKPPIEMFAERINAGAYVASSAIGPAMAREMLERGLVTAEKLREAGVHV